MRYAIWLAAAALAVAGCKGTGTGGGAEMASDCDRDVSVQVIGGKLSLDPDPVHVCKNRKVTWKLVDFQEKQGFYEFRADSVTIDGPLSEFPNCSLKGKRNGELNGKSMIKCDDANTIKGGFDYYIKIYWVDGAEAANSDPTIVNY